MRSVVAFLALFLGAHVAYGQSELRFASHLEIHGVATAVGAATVVSTADTVTVVSDRGTRTESHQMVPAIVGSIVIQRADGTFLLDERAKTYFKTPVPAFVTFPALLPKRDASYSRTGEFAVIAGIRSERVSFKVTAEIPGTTGTPTVVETTGDVWVADQFSAYTNKMGSDMAGAAMQGAGGFPLRTVVRGRIVGPYEIDVTVTSVAEEPFQPELFEPPPDYTERSTPGN
jgi:hypothetical protein